METVLEIIKIVSPIIFVGIISIFVISMLVGKQRRGKLGKMKTKKAQIVLDTLIPIGMLIGANVGILLSMFYALTMSLGIFLGAGIGMLCGYIAYEISSKLSAEHS